MSDADNDLRSLSYRTLRLICICAIAVLFCYFFVDRQVAFFMHERSIDKFAVFKWLTYPPPVVQIWSPLVIAILAVGTGFGPWKVWQHTLFIACVSLIVADQFRYSIGDAAGRYWPETWHNDNPSLIVNGAYGFHPFHAGDDEGSFPSGHAARIAGFMGVFWFMYPRTRLLCALIAVPMLVALVAMNYHFVGDVVAGTVLGAIVAAWAVRSTQAPAASGEAK